MRRSERGISESVQWAVILPALLLCVLGLVQTGVWLHGQNVIASAAAAAAEAESLSRAPTGAGERAARTLATPGGVTDLDVQVVRGPTQVNVTVTGRVPTFFDVGQGRITARATHPIEQETR